MKLQYDRTVVLLGIYPKEMKTCVHTKIYMQMFRAALLMIVKTWKQLKCPLTGDG